MPDLPEVTDTPEFQTGHLLWQMVDFPAAGFILASSTVPGTEDFHSFIIQTMEVTGADLRI